MAEPGSAPFEVFLSHFSEEASIARLVQDHLQRVFPGLRVFCSSDSDSIRTGTGQYGAIARALQECKVYVILVSEYSAKRPWVNFELGFGTARNVPLFPVLVREVGAGDVPSPL